MELGRLWQRFVGLEVRERSWDIHFPTIEDMFNEANHDMPNRPDEL